MIYLQNDRTTELHTQGGFHHRTRIPRFGRSIAYHFPSCDAYISASGNEVYRLNLDQGRFIIPLVLQEESDSEILGVNTIDINPAHQLLAFGIEGNGTAQFWDPGSRSCVGTLRLPRNLDACQSKRPRRRNPQHYSHIISSGRFVLCHQGVEMFGAGLEGCRGKNGIFE